MTRNPTWTHLHDKAHRSVSARWFLLSPHRLGSPPQEPQSQLAMGSDTLDLGASNGAFFTRLSLTIRCTGMSDTDQSHVPLIGQHPSTRRKYLAEGGLHLFTGGPALFRPSDLYRFSQHPWFRAALDGTNIYLICRRRRISVCPLSIEIREGGLHGEFIVHGDNYLEWERERFALARTHTDPDGNSVRFVAARAADPFGHAVEVIDENGRRGLMPSSVLLASSKHSIGVRSKLEVLYVGQSFGKAGERISADRLKRHSTLQRILADCVDESGTTEILLLGFQYGSSKNWMSTAGDRWVEPTATEEEERAYMATTGHRSFDRKVRILLAEAALINYFKPQYNELHLASFHPHNNRKLKTLRKLFESDMSALIVEINTANIRAKLWSPAAPRCTMEAYLTPEREAEMRTNALSGDSPLTAAQVDEWLSDQSHAHIARFPLYEKSARETFLHAFPWGSHEA